MCIKQCANGIEICDEADDSGNKEFDIHENEDALSKLYTQLQLQSRLQKLERNHMSRKSLKSARLSGWKILACCCYFIIIVVLI